MQRSSIDLEETRRVDGQGCTEVALRLKRREDRVDGTRMLRSCLKLEERRRVEGTRIQSSCLE